jgi:hypothetical protein
MAETTVPDHSSRTPRRRKRRAGLIVLVSLLVIVLLAGVLLLLAPRLLSGYVPAMAQRNINQEIQGRATVGSASLSWTGAQRIGPIDIVDLDGRPVASIDVETSRSLLAILRIVTGAAPMDLGTTTVRGSATIIRRPDGTIHLQDVFQPTPPDQPPHDVYLPETLTGRFILDGLDLTFIDERQLSEGAETAVIRVPALSAEASLAGHFVYGPHVDATTRRGGSLQMRVAVDNLTEPDGRLVLEQASYNASMDLVDVSTAVADVLSAMEGRLVQAIGPQLQAQLRLDGTLANGRFRVGATAEGLDADVRLETAGGVLRTPQPGRIAVRDGGLFPLIPGFAAAAAQQDDVTFDRLPGATITLDDVRIPLPIGERPPDLRGGTFNLSLQTGETTGMVRVPEADGMPGTPRAFRIAPIRASIASSDLGDRIDIRARTVATIGDEPAGTLEVDLTAIEPLDAQGQLRPALARDISGGASLSGFATVLLQPFVEPMGIVMAQDVGPRLDLRLRAEASPAMAEWAGAQADDERSAMALPPTRLTFDMRSANITGAAAALLHDNVLTSNEQPIELRIQTIAPLVTRLIRDDRLLVEAGGGIHIAAHDVRIDLGRPGAEEPGAQLPEHLEPAGHDLRAVSGMLQVETTALMGRLALEDQPVRRWQIRPGSATIDAADLQGGITILAQTEARLEGQPAGTLDIDLRITDLLDAGGRVLPGLPAIEGRASLTEIATAILQPIAEEMGLDLQRGAGPRLNVQIVASTEAAFEAGAVPRSILDIGLRSERVTGEVPLMLEGATLRTRDGGALLTVHSPGVLLRPGMRDTGLEMADGGHLRLGVRNLMVALDAAGVPLLDRASGEIDVALGQLSIRPSPLPPAAPGAPLSLEQLTLAMRFAPQRPPVVDLRGAGTHQEAAFTAQGAMELIGLDGTMDLAAIRPIGEIQIRNVPTSLVSIVMAPAPEQMFDTAQLIQDMAGPSVNINIAASAIQGHPTDRRLTLAARSQQLNAEAAVDLDDGAVHVRQFDLGATISAQLAGLLLQTFLGEQLAAPPHVMQPARLTAALQPISIPLVNGVPDLEAAGTTTLRAGLEGRLLVENLILAETPERPARPVGMLGLQDFALEAEIPMAALAADGPPAAMRFTMNGTVLGAPDRPLMDIRSQGQGHLAAGQPAGPMTADVQLAVADLVRFDEILGQDGMLAQAVGASLDISADANIEFPGPQAPGAQAAPDAPAFQRAAISATLQSPRMQTVQPMQLTVLPDRVDLTEPTMLRWDVHPEWANRFVLGHDPGAPADPQEARFAQPMAVQLALSSLTLARGEDVGPLLPGVFAAGARVTAAAADLVVGGEPARLAGIDAHIISGHEPNVIGFNITIQDAGRGAGPGGEPAVAFAGGLYNIADPMGNFAMGSAVLSTEGSARGIPTALVDGFAGQGGFLVDALGPSVDLTVDGRGLSPEGGHLRARATSERASGELIGTIRGMRFIAEEAANISISVITPEMGQRIAGGLPIVGHFEKTTAEEPAALTALQLVLPLDGDLTGLNGQFTFDPGEARFGISRGFAPLLRLIDEPREAVVGRRLQPISLAIIDGILSYERINIPIGQFNFAMEGTVDLARRQIDVVTFVPFGALTEEAGGDVQSSIGGVLGILSPALPEGSLVPFRVRGGFEDFSIEPDVQMMARELQGELLRPDRLVPRDILDRLRPRRNENNNGDGR